MGLKPGASTEDKRMPKSPTNRTLPLAGKRVIVGRPRAQAGALSAKLRALGARVIEIPFLEVRPPRSYAPLDEALRRHAEYDWLVLTSVNGVAVLCRRLARLRIATADLAQLKIAAIGPATRSALEAQGLRVDVMPREYVAEAVVARLRRRVKGKRVLLVRARIARDVIPRELRAAGAQVDVREAYVTVVPEKSRARLLAALQSKTGRPDVITLTSSSAAKNFLALIGGSKAARSAMLDGAGAVLASIGPVTTQTLRELNLPGDDSRQRVQYPRPGGRDCELLPAAGHRS